MQELQYTPGVKAGCETIHFEACANLTGVHVHHNVANYSIVTGGLIGANISHNIVHGTIQGFNNDNITVSDNVIIADGISCPLLTEACPHGATITGNTLISAALPHFQPVGISIIGAAPYDPHPAAPYRVARDVAIRENFFVGAFSQPEPWQGKAKTCVQHGRMDARMVYLDGVVNATVEGNTLPPRSGNITQNTCACCEHYSPHINFDEMCQEVVIKSDDIEAVVPTRFTAVLKGAVAGLKGGEAKRLFDAVYSVKTQAFGSDALAFSDWLAPAHTQIYRIGDNCSDTLTWRTAIG